jgi:[acyl-carrier-protein] S-malonyltransferase
MVNDKFEAIFLFPGQGAQYPAMAMDLFDESAAVRDLFRVASAAAARDMVELLRTAEADELKRSDVSQPAITLANLAAATLLRERGVLPSACAGFSLGEYAALVTAGVLSAEDCFRLVAARGSAMQKAADRISAAAAGEAPGMAAVLGLPCETVEALIGEWKAGGLEGLYAANFNSPRQTVVAGTAAALAEAEARFKVAGAKRVIRLQVAGPFHSPLMAEASDEFAPILESVPFADPTLPLFSNVSGGRIATGEEAKRLALRQITESVRWTAEEAALAALEAKAALEVGPGKVLSGLWKESGSSVPCFAAGTVADIDAALTATSVH